ncbi:unnamed protein product [Urochloa decumbens]|uniref:GTD-binding domain-containing protein n=1 Tax=Urochloa decumbens TaxID=240449 RepID=A0ABC9BXV0_9POAL
MAGEDDDPCPLCGASGGPARVTLAGRGSPPHAGDDALLAVTAVAGPSEEAAALREELARERRWAADLHAELEAERAAAEGAASEAMSMILRLQRDKSEALMEARQYRYAEERFAHDAAERRATGRARAPRRRGAGARRAAPARAPPTRGSSSSAPRATPASRWPTSSPSSRLTTIRTRPDEDDDRVYTVDAVHGVPVMAPEDCCYLGAPMGDEEVGFRAVGGGWAEEAEIQKLKARLQALEADRESMRHAIMSMGEEKAQVVLLREIAQQLCRDATPFPAVPLKVQPRLQPVVVTQRKVVKKRSSFFKFFIVTVLKWVASLFCWRRKSNRIRYSIGMCGSNVGLMLVLDRFPKQRQKKIPKRKLSASIL